MCGESFVPDMRREGVSGESFVPHVRRARVCWESFVPEGPGAVVVGRIMSCSGLVLVPVAGLWQRPGAAHGLRGQAVPRSLFWGCGVGRVLSRQPVLRRSWRRRGSLQASDRWGFCTTRSLLTPCRRRVGPPCRAIPPGGVWVFRTVCFERVVLSSPGCLWPGRMDDHEEVLEAHA